jgi:hypothetical protein
MLLFRFGFVLRERLSPIQVEALEHVKRANGKSRTAGRPSPPGPLSQLWERGSFDALTLSQSWETRQRLGGEGRFRGVLLFPFGVKRASRENEASEVAIAQILDRADLDDA